MEMKKKENAGSWEEDWLQHKKGPFEKKPKTGISISEDRVKWWPMASEYLVQWDSKKAE